MQKLAARKCKYYRRIRVNKWMRARAPSKGRRYKEKWRDKLQHTDINDGPQGELWFADLEVPQALPAHPDEAFHSPQLTHLGARANAKKMHVSFVPGIKFGRRNPTIHGNSGTALRMQKLAGSFIIDNFQITEKEISWKNAYSNEQDLEHVRFRLENVVGGIRSFAIAIVDAQSPGSGDAVHGVYKPTVSKTDGNFEELLETFWKKYPQTVAAEVESGRE
ncbi:hypothetical protein F5879DRAFT_1019597 [Lentinula edodes]|nr:hypothetical protein F5879DRAFT_1019597 [Lentinula edodes]